MGGIRGDETAGKRPAGLFWLAELVVPALGAAGFSISLSAVGYLAHGLEPSLWLAFVYFFVFWLGLVLLFSGRLPAKYRAWRRFRELPHDRRTRSTAEALFRAERRQGRRR